MVAYTGSAAFSDIIDAPVDRLFDFLDDQSNLSSHMSKSSWMMLGSTMDVYMDAESTRAVGSKFGFRGAIVGVPLAVDQVVIGREPPLRKTWETVGEPCLWVIGRYRMGLELTPEGRRQACVFSSTMFSPPAVCCEFWVDCLATHMLAGAPGKW